MDDVLLDVVVVAELVQGLQGLAFPVEKELLPFKVPIIGTLAFVGVGTYQ